ncbi:MAG: sulfatase-like hydrolase/transferase [Verrucomicrobiota bacterium]
MRLTLFPSIVPILAITTFTLLQGCDGSNQTASSTETKAAKEPNIIIYMVDDMGYGSVNCYGADPELVQTPHIDGLAEMGMSFINASTTASVCSPTRYTMLTGRYSWRTHLKAGVVNTNDPLLINPERTTIASWLQEKGYETAHFGKWHLGYFQKQFKNLLGDITPGPNDIGFDYHFGVPNNMDDIHKVYIENNGIYGLRSDRISNYGISFYGKQYTGYDAPQRNEPEVMPDITSRAAKWIQERDGLKPFFLYFASVSVHHPIMPSAKNFGSSKAGAYGDFIHDTDESVGEIIKALKEKGELENTIFIFTSDNGGDIPTKAPKIMPENQAIEAGLKINGDWRGDKHEIYEGGLRVPLIVSYPKVVQPGTKTSAFATTADLFATVAGMLGTDDLPETVAPDSISFSHVLSDPDAASKRVHGVFRNAPGQQALRFGKWKLIDSQLPNGTELTLELYDLEADPGETKNLSEDESDVVRQGQELLATIRKGPGSRDVPLP